MTTLTLPAPDTAVPYHWTPTSQRQFLEHLAETGSITRAAASVAMSPRSAHNLRHRRDGAAFRIGWDAALLVARAALADSLMERAIDGQVETVTRDGDTLTRRRHDNRLGMSLLTRLDRIAATDLAEGGDGALARLVSQDFEAFLDLVERGGSGAEAALFVAARDPAEPVEIERNGQCELGAPDTEAEEPEPEAIAGAMRVWLSANGEQWLTDFPPPPGFGGFESHGFGAPDYERTLTAAEEAAADLRAAAELAPLTAAGEAARDAWFGFAPPEAEALDPDREEEEEEDAYGHDPEDFDAAWDGLAAPESDFPVRHCERSEAIQPAPDAPLDCVAPLAMTGLDSEPEPEPEPEPDPGYRRIPVQPRPRPYANGRPPDYVRDFNRGLG